MQKKSLQEIRETGRARQARWRAKHIWLARERVREVRGKSRAQTLGLAGVDEDSEQLPPLEKKVVMPRREVAELSYGPVEGVDAPWEPIPHNLDSQPVARAAAILVSKAHTPHAELSPKLEFDGVGLGTYAARSAKVRQELIVPPQEAARDLSPEEKRLLSQIERLKKRRPKGIIVEGFE